MTRNVTAVYRTHSTADLVRRELEGLGISRSYIHVIPDEDRGTAGASSGAAGTDTSRTAGTDPTGIGPSGTAGIPPTATVGMTPAATTSADATGVTTSGAGYGSDNRYVDMIDDLHLPDDDSRTYKHCVRRGDYVVSVEVDDDQVERAVQIMRRPESETHNLHTRSDEFRTEEDIPRRQGWTTDETRLGARDTTHDDPFTRSYQRKGRLEERR